MKILSVIAVMFLVTAATMLSQFYYAEKITTREMINNMVDAILTGNMKNYCAQLNITKCSNLTELGDEVCRKHGQQSQDCADARQAIEDISNQKSTLYDQPLVSGISLASINLSISQSMPLIVLVIIACLLVVYWVNKSVRSVLKATVMALLMTGISCLAVWLALKSMLSSMPLIAVMISDMAAYEMTVGFASILLAVLIFVVLKFTKAELTKKPRNK